MKKLKYTTPELTTVAFDAADIIAASIGAFDGEWVSIGGNTNEEEELA